LYKVQKPDLHFIISTFHIDFTEREQRYLLYFKRYVILYLIVFYSIFVE